MLRSSAAVESAMQPLYLCDPEKPACYRRGGPGALATVEREKKRFAAAAAATDHPCLREGADLYGEGLDALADASRAASNANVVAYDKYSARSTRLTIAFMRKLGSCGFSQGRTAEMSAAMREINATMLRIGDAIAGCRALPCVKRFARRMETTAERGVTQLDRYLATVPDDAPPCLRTALSLMRTAFVAAEQTGIAIQQERFAAAERQGIEAGKAEVKAMRTMASCVRTI